MRPKRGVCFPGSGQDLSAQFIHHYRWNWCGEVETKKSPAEQLEELAEKVDDLEREQLAEEILRIAGLLAA